MTPQPLKRALLLLIGASFCAIIGYFSYSQWARTRFIEHTDNAYVRSAIVAIAPKVPGYVVTLNVDDNQHVEAGDILFRLDPADYEAQRDQAQAHLNAMRAARASLDEERILQDALISEAEAGLTATRAEAQRAGRDRVRADDLAREGWTSEQRLDSAIAIETRANASVAQAQAGLAARRQRLSVLTAEATRLDATIEQAEAQLRLAEIAVGNTILRAPVSGIIGNRHVEVGHYARPGAPLLSIVPSQNVWIVANFKETQLEYMRAGQVVNVRIRSFGDLSLSGHIDSLAPASGAEFSLLPPDNATGNFVRIVQRIPIKITLDAQQDEAIAALRPGMSADVYVDTRNAPKTLIAQERVE